jgi:DNA-binding LacI/PurR family transcriptional regulator
MTTPARIELDHGIQVSAGLVSVLRRRREKTVALVAQDLTHWQAAELAISANSSAAAQGFRLISLDFHRSAEREHLLLQSILQADVAGAIFLWDHAPENLHLYEQLVRSRPCVQVLVQKPIDGLDFVGIDDYAGARLAMHHLINLGHRQIGHVTLRTGMECVHERQRGYVDALRRIELAPVAEWTLDLQYGLTEPNRAMRMPEILRFLSQPHLPKALFVCADWLASEVVECAQELGLSIPDDLAIVGFDDEQIHSLTGVPLTTVRSDLPTLGRTAVEFLLARMRDDVAAPMRRILVSPTLVVRESSARLAVTAERWASVVRFVEDNYRRDLSAREAAGLVGLDPHYFSHLFAQVFGRRFTDLISEMRLRAATQLLATTDRTVECIACEVGFGSLNHFYTVFKRAHGVSPHAYRKRHRMLPVA